MNRKTRVLAVFCVVSLMSLLVSWSTVVPVNGATSCELLTSLSLPNVTITSAQTVAAGALTLPAAGAARGGAQTDEILKTLPAFCRVAATLQPSTDSDIKMEVWMPVSNWNGKYQAVGNGGWGGTLAYRPTAIGRSLSDAVRGGYATSSTDTGHTGGNAAFALGHPEKLIDFGWRAVHEMAVTSKKIIASYYESGPKFSYWNGCSAGGRQATKEAQKYPADFDGIIAGAPAIDWTARAASSPSNRANQPT